MGTPTRASPKPCLRQAKWAGSDAREPACESFRQADHLLLYMGPQAAPVRAAGSIGVGMADVRPWEEGEGGGLAFFP